MNPATPGEYRDRKTGLTVFGILEIVLGAMAWLLVPLTLLSLALAPQAGGTAPPLAALLPAALMYAAGGAVFISLGIGSIRGRRWARALWVCGSAIGLGTGLLSFPFVVYVTIVDLPRTMAATSQVALPPAALVVAQVVTIAITLLLYVVLPGAIFLFYRSPHVKHTCERLDPQERWTDQCPLPVLALSLLIGVGAFVMPVFSLGMGMPAPVLGRFVGGTPGLLLVIGSSALMLYIALGLYHLRPAAWWLCLVGLLMLALSANLTFWNADLKAVYEKMGFDPAMAARSADMAQRVKWTGVVGMIPWLVWVLYVRRYFRKPPADDAAA